MDTYQIENNTKGHVMNGIMSPRYERVDVSVAPFPSHSCKSFQYNKTPSHSVFLKAAERICSSLGFCMVEWKARGLLGQRGTGFLNPRSALLLSP